MPSVECPVGDFFASAYQGGFAQLTSLPVCVNPGSAFNCYWEMPFRKRCRMTVENLAAEDMVLYYQIDYTLTEVPEDCAPYAGMPRVIRPDGTYQSQERFSLYRWHIMDPIRFTSDLKVTIQALGWRSGGRYLPLQDDIASVAFWYQTLPAAPFPQLPDADGLEII